MKPIKTNSFFQTTLKPGIISRLATDGTFFSGLLLNITPVFVIAFLPVVNEPIVDNRKASLISMNQAKSSTQERAKKKGAMFEATTPALTRHIGYAKIALDGESAKV
jgi:hypothetical protein